VNLIHLKFSEPDSESLLSDEPEWLLLLPELDDELLLLHSLRYEGQPRAGAAMI